jgi:hypothetical protein
MPIHGYPGNVITSNAVVPNSGSASGVWTTEQQLQAQNAGNWPQANQILRSLRFNSADTAYLNRTPASAGNRRTWTWSAWVKRSNLSAAQTLFSASNDSTTQFFISLLADNTLQALDWNGSVNLRAETLQVFRDASAWYHIVFAVDTTQATSTNRWKLYVNGAQVTSFSGSSGYPSQNYDTAVNATVAHAVGREEYADTNYLNGYMTEVNFIDGQALTPSSFGQTNGNTGVWEPKRYSGSYGTNGFYLTFQDNSGTTSTTLGKDYSGNGNNWTPNNFSVSAGAGNDSLVDTPTPYGVDTGVGGEVRGNYATWNPLVVNKPTLTNGNLDADGSDLKTAISTMGVSSGKWYWEITIGSGTNTPNMGVTSFANDNADPGVYLGVGRSYVSGSGVYKNYTATSTVADSDFSNANTAGAVIGFALDCDAGTLAYYVNNVLGHTDTTVAAGTVLYPMTCNFNSAANNYRNTSVNFGQRPFAYTAPSGYKALCTQNLPTPTIGATSTTQAGKYFNPVLYTGTGSTLSVTGVGFQPDFVWVKKRSSSSYGHVLVDAVRGASLRLFSNTTDGESSGGGGNTVSAFNSDGFTVLAGSDVNDNGGTFVGWNWKANGAGSSNTAGSITSTVSANTTSGFSIVTWTGNGAEVTVGHGLGAVPSLIIHKFRSAISNWSVYTATTGAGKRLKLNSTDAVATDGSFPVAPTSTVFSINAGSNDPGVTMLAYCFAEVPGYSRFGSYTGNGSSDGPFIFTGFRPRYLLIKDTTGATNYWVVLDTSRSPYNAAALGLYPNTSDADDAFTYADILSNGFKIRNSSGNTNTSSSIYIYAAFAESPFKYALAR